MSCSRKETLYAFEAGIVTGVEAAERATPSEVHTHEVLEDDVPEEYLNPDHSKKDLRNQSAERNRCREFEKGGSGPCSSRAGVETPHRPLKSR